MTRQSDYALRAEMRAVEEGHRARLNEDGSISVKSDSDPNATYRVTFHPVDLLIKFDCDCPSGTYREDLFVPCKHAALAARRLERRGLAHWVDGYWLLTDKARDILSSNPEPPVDPLAGLPGADS